MRYLIAALFALCLVAPAHAWQGGFPSAGNSSVVGDLVVGGGATVDSLGVGVAAPGTSGRAAVNENLTVGGDVTIGDGKYIANTSDDDTGIFLNGDGMVRLRTNGANTFEANASGSRTYNDLAISYTGNGSDTYIAFSGTSNATANNDRARLQMCDDDSGAIGATDDNAGLAFVFTPTPANVAASVVGAWFTSGTANFTGTLGVTGAVSAGGTSLFTNASISGIATAETFQAEAGKALDLRMRAGYGCNVNDAGSVPALAITTTGNDSGRSTVITATRELADVQSTGTLTYGGTLGATDGWAFGEAVDVNGTLSANAISASGNVVGAAHYGAAGADTILVARTGQAVTVHQDQVGSVTRARWTTNGDPDDSDVLLTVTPYNSGAQPMVVTFDAGDNRVELDHSFLSSGNVYASQGCRTDSGYSMGVGAYVVTRNALSFADIGAAFVQAAASTGEVQYDVDTTTFALMKPTAGYASIKCGDVTATGTLNYSSIVTIDENDSAYAVLATDLTILLEPDGGNISVTLPAATGSGRILEFTALTASGANDVTLDAATNSGLINGAGTNTTLIDAQWDSGRIQDVATNVWIIK